jgi:hypothetical protein
MGLDGGSQFLFISSILTVAVVICCSCSAAHTSRSLTAGQVYFPLCILFRINDGPLWQSIACVSYVRCGYGQDSFCEEIAGARESQGYM